MPDHPAHIGLVALAAALPGCWYAGKSVTARLFVNGRDCAVVAPGVAAAGWLLLVHALGLAFHSFTKALLVGTMCLSATGTALWVRAGCPFPRIRSGTLTVLRRHSTAALATLLIAPMAVRWCFHDEAASTGHWSLIAQLENELYPPRVSAFPDVELAYHYGFDVLAAAVAMIARVSPSTAIDAVTIIAWFYAWLLLSRLGVLMVGHRGEFLTPLIVLLSAGIPIALGSSSITLLEALLGQYQIRALPPNPPVVSYFFQHPWAVGIPIATCSLIVYFRARRAPLRGIVLAVLLAALSVSQFVLFVSLVSVLWLDTALSVVRRQVQLPQAAWSMVPLAVAVGAAYELRGFFANSAPLRDAFAVSVGVVPGTRALLAWHAASFGLLIPVGIAGVRAAGRMGAVVSGMSALGLIVPTLIRYRATWDIVKFSTIASIGLGILASAGIARLLRAGHMSRLLAVGLACGLIAPGLVHPVAFGFAVGGIPEEGFPRREWNVGADDAEAIRWLRRRVSRDELVFRSLPAAWAYSSAGLAQPWLDGPARLFGGRARARARQRVLDHRPLRLDELATEGVRWVVLDARNQKLRGAVDEWVGSGKARLVNQFGELTVFRIQ